MALDIKSVTEAVDSIFHENRYQQVALENNVPQSERLTWEQFVTLTDALNEKILAALNNHDEQVKEVVDALVQGNIKTRYLVELSSEQRTPKANFIPTIMAALRNSLWG